MLSLLFLFQRLFSFFGLVLPDVEISGALRAHRLRLGQHLNQQVVTRKADAPDEADLSIKMQHEKGASLFSMQGKEFRI